jgi:pimeloyl-ACP methyl ester carboxylesterase
MRPILLAFLFLLTALGVMGQETQIERMAEHLKKNNISNVHKMLGRSARQQLSKKQLTKIWKSIQRQMGDVESYGAPSVSETQRGMLHELPLQMEKGGLLLKITENDKGEVGSLFFSPANYEMPTYAQNIRYGKKRFKVRSDTFVLPGELIFPLGKTDFPIVLLVHGSGPHDMDETIGPNKVFKDLALGLCQLGIGTFRYQKRFKKYPEGLELPFTLYEETVQDAIAAVRLIQSDTQFNQNPIFILGHSLGAFAAPILADSLGSGINGTILFSGNTRRLEDLIAYQVEYLSGLDGEVNFAEKQTIKLIEKRAEKIRSLDYKASDPSKKMLGYWPGSFWLDIHYYSPSAKVDSLSERTPFLILQGEKDYQITMVDFVVWDSMARANENIKAVSYPGLNHLFIEDVNEKSQPGSYWSAGNVEYVVLEDIANWVKAQSE